MGGAIALLASLDIAQLTRRRRHNPFATHHTYTFAAPRLGNRNFADFFSRSFPRADQHWALQAASDAVPHLPFAAWGYEHPGGVLKLGKPRPRRSGDLGDSVDFLRPKEGKPASWIESHDLSSYIHQLHELGGVTPPPVEPTPSASAAQLPSTLPLSLMGL